MELMKIIEEYIQLSMKRDKLNEDIKHAQDNHFYAKIEGDMAYYEGNYEREEGYNRSANRQIVILENAKEELNRIYYFLHFTHYNYTNQVSVMDAEELRKVLAIITRRVSDTDMQIEKLTELREEAMAAGDVAFAEHDFEEEQKNNDTAIECYRKIDLFEKVSTYYKSFERNLEYRINNKIAKKI